MKTARWTKEDGIRASTLAPKKKWENPFEPFGFVMLVSKEDFGEAIHMSSYQGGMASSQEKMDFLRDAMGMILENCDFYFYVSLAEKETSFGFDEKRVSGGCRFGPGESEYLSPMVNAMVVEALLRKKINILDEKEALSEEALGSSTASKARAKI